MTLVALGLAGGLATWRDLRAHAAMGARAVAAGREQRVPTRGGND
jgi:NAD(P)H-dependent flavin oxidoreductase YrpB (nitropropane dioxygenase family)